MTEFPEIQGYELLEELGHGGMATVYRARQISLDREIAVKVMSPALAADREFSERFQREARTAASLQHPNIVSIFDTGASGHHNYIAMEWVRGGDLKDKLRLGALESSQAVSIASQIASALGYAHERGFVHRDVKPENILFREDGSAVLTDFGIARATGSGTRMTATGLSIGTPHYMSPEQARGKAVDGRSDLYALGVVFYEMLTGRVPFEAQDSFAVGLMHINDAPPALQTDLRRYQPVLDRLLAKDPSDRYQQGADLLAELDRLVTSGSVEPAPGATRVVRQAAKSVSGAPIDRQKKGQAWLWGLGGGALAAIAATVMYVNTSGSLGPLGDGASVGEQRAASIPARSFAAGRAIVDIRSTPPGAEVYLGYELVGTTPFQADDLPAGQHQLRLVSRYYQPWEQRLVLEDGVVERIDATLQRGVGRVTVTTAPPGAAVWMDGEEVEGKTPLTLSDLQSGEQSIEIRLDRYRTMTRTIEVLPGDTARLDLALEGGDLHEWEGRWLTADEIVPLLLEAAEADLGATRLMAPDGNNAWEKYRRVLYIQPGNGMAAAGIERIAARYVELARGALAEEQLDRAEAFLANARTAGASGSTYQRANDALEAAEAERRAEQQRRELIGAIQSELARLGRNVRETGTLDPSTVGMIRAYERAAERPQRGAATATLLAELQQLERWPAPRRQPGEAFRDCPVCPEMVVIPAGSFRMGSPASEPQRDRDEGPQRRVTVPAFAMGKTEVTFAQWNSCADAGGCRYRRSGLGSEDEDRPVINVSWNDAQEYVRWLSRETGEDYRLPSEAEWEYAARAGTTTRFHTGNCISTDQANFDGDRPASNCPRGEDWGTARPVGSFEPNAFGLYDMHGNVWEWVQDCWNDNYRAAPSDGSAWMTGNCGRAVRRGGARSGPGAHIRSANRHSERSRSFSGFGTGFRVARSVAP